ncbi:class I SAM-dependent methyltransferase [Sorangium cellulosum]|uniref:class I SAM-dependent methyltransferase n=1 Tax=Sorangium cellulosum TaxID=56 RepID=UPI003D9A6D03
MIAYARQLEAEQPLSIEYHVMDAVNARDLGALDVVTATYLLHYAPSLAIVREMCARCARASTRRSRRADGWCPSA